MPVPRRGPQAGADRAAVVLKGGPEGVQVIMLVPRPGLPRGVQAGRRVSQVVQGGGDVITPLPDRVLGGAQLQRREHQDIDREPGDHPDTDIDQPGGEIMQRLVAAYQQHEQVP